MGNVKFQIPFITKKFDLYNRPLVFALLQVIALTRDKVRLQA